MFSIDDPVELIDVMPTIFDAAGVTLPKTAQGQSLLPLADVQLDADVSTGAIRFREHRWQRLAASVHALDCGALAPVLGGHATRRAHGIRKKPQWR